MIERTCGEARSKMTGKASMIFFYEKSSFDTPLIFFYIIIFMDTRRFFSFSTRSSGFFI